MKVFTYSTSANKIFSGIKLQRDRNNEKYLLRLGMKFLNYGEFFKPIYINICKRNPAIINNGIILNAELLQKNKKTLCFTKPHKENLNSDNFIVRIKTFNMQQPHCNGYWEPISGSPIIIAEGYGKIPYSNFTYTDSIVIMKPGDIIKIYSPKKEIFILKISHLKLEVLKQ